MPTNKKPIGRRSADAIDESLTHGLEHLIPFLCKLEIISEGTNIDHIKDSDLKQLAEHWSVPLIDKKSGHRLSFTELIKILNEKASKIALRRAEERLTLK